MGSLSSSPVCKPPRVVFDAGSVGVFAKEPFHLFAIRDVSDDETPDAWKPFPQRREHKLRAFSRYEVYRSVEQRRCGVEAERRRFRPFDDIPDDVFDALIRKVLPGDFDQRRSRVHPDAPPPSPEDPRRQSAVTAAKVDERLIRPKIQEPTALRHDHIDLVFADRRAADRPAHLTPEIAFIAVPGVYLVYVRRVPRGGFLALRRGFFSGHVSPNHLALASGRRDVSSASQSPERGDGNGAATWYRR